MKETTTEYTLWVSWEDDKLVFTTNATSIVDAEGNATDLIVKVRGKVSSSEIEDIRLFVGCAPFGGKINADTESINDFIQDYYERVEMCNLSRSLIDNFSISFKDNYFLIEKRD